MLYSTEIHAKPFIMNEQHRLARIKELKEKRGKGWLEFQELAMLEGQIGVETYNRIVSDVRIMAREKEEANRLQKERMWGVA